MTRHTDFLIVGGGPAGASTAIGLAQFGREVVLIERTTYDRPRIGETLPSAAKRVLERLGLVPSSYDVCGVRCPGTASAWGSDQLYWNDSVLDPDGEGLHLDRTAFDRLLAERAVAAGVEVRMGQTVRSCRKIGRLWSVTIAGSGGDRELRAPTLIDASGRASWPGRPLRRQAFDRQVALVRLYAGDEERSLGRRTWIEASQDGWWYSAALPGGRTAAAYFTDADLLRVPASRRETCFDQLLQKTRWTSERLQAVQTDCELRIVPASSTIAVPVAGDGWVAVGDAASTIDPLSSQGIYYAITTGLAAAEALNDSDRDAALERYVRAIRARFLADLVTRTRFCRRERRWPDSPFWRRRSEFSPEMSAAAFATRFHFTGSLPRDRKDAS